MIIVSQDRKSIYNFNNVKSMDVLDNEIYISDNILIDEGIFIGEYTTEERAKEVLEEIYSEYSIFEIYKNETNDFNKTKELKEIIESGSIPFIYRMPTE